MPIAQMICLFLHEWGILASPRMNHAPNYDRVYISLWRDEANAHIQTLKKKEHACMIFIMIENID